MKRNACETIKDIVKTHEGITYRYILLSSKSIKVASFNMPLYSIEIIMNKDGVETCHTTNDIFSDIGKALVFFDKLVDNLATPIDLPYILEDMGCRI